MSGLDTSVHAKPWQVGLVLLATLTGGSMLRFDSLERYWQQSRQQALPLADLPRIPVWPPLLDVAQAADVTWQAETGALMQRLDLVGKVALAGNQVLLPPAAGSANAAACQSNAPVNSGASIASPGAQQKYRLDAKGQIILSGKDRVLLAGDSMMQGVAPHIVRTLRKEFGVEGVDLSKQSTGLAYISSFDWPATLGRELGSGKFSVLVMLIGANDTWDMSFNGRNYNFGAQGWYQGYSSRVRTILESARQHNVRVVWMGMPPMGRDKMADRVPVLNQVLAQEIGKAGQYARYLETGPVMSEDGKTFCKFLDLPEKGKVMVRAEDGVHFTATGQKLLARLALNQFSQSKPVGSP